MAKPYCWTYAGRLLCEYAKQSFIQGQLEELALGSAIICERHTGCACYLKVKSVPFGSRHQQFLFRLPALEIPSLLQPSEQVFRAEADRCTDALHLANRPFKKNLKCT